MSTFTFSCCLVTKIFKMEDELIFVIVILIKLMESHIKLLHNVLFIAGRYS